MFRPRVDRILFAATKADHLHHTSHERLEAILARMIERAAARASAAGAPVDVVALSAVRATNEAKVRRGREELPCIVGVPAQARWRAARCSMARRKSRCFRAICRPIRTRCSVPRRCFRGLASASPQDADFRFLRLRPPTLEQVDGIATLPHIRLDRALQFLIGDQMP